MNVLVVEDNKPVSMLICRVVEELGYGYVLAADGEAALKLYRQRDVDMLVVDVELPGLDGFQVAREIRGEAGDQIPIIFISGNTGEAYHQQARDAGGDAFLPKPIRPGDLKQILSRYLPQPSHSS
jgi:two-component system cell cycle response regulator DivK